MKLQYPLRGIGVLPGIFQSQGFGEHPEVYSQMGMKGHNGIDYACPTGTFVYPAHDGRLVTQPTEPDGYGIHVRVYWEEDGVTKDTVYGHLQSPIGHDRDVTTRDAIGISNNTGFSTGPHLHFGIRDKTSQNGTVINYDNGFFGYYDPIPYLKGDNMVVYKKIGDGTLYFPVGTVLVGYATDFPTFETEFPGAVIIELPEAEFNKFSISKLVVK